MDKYEVWVRDGFPYSHLSQNIVIEIYALFPPIFFLAEKQNLQKIAFRLSPNCCQCHDHHNFLSGITQQLVGGEDAVKAFMRSVIVTNVPVPTMIMMAMVVMMIFTIT